MMRYIFLCLFMMIHTLWGCESVLIVVGPPGSGKGNFSQFLKANYGYNHVSAGDLLREEVDKRTPIGVEIAATFQRGEAVPADLMQRLLAEKIRILIGAQKPFIIDGFGGQHQHDMIFLHHLLEQYALLDKTVAIFFDAADDVCERRMSGRFICPQCAYIYNSHTLPPREEGQCDTCHQSLVQRSQDTPQTIISRLLRYRATMAPNYEQAERLFYAIHYDTNSDACAEYYENLINNIVNR